jgi:hypothetical protein
MYLCGKQKIDLGILKPNLLNYKKFYIINKNPIDIKLSYFDIDGEYIFKDFYSLKFNLSLYK